MKISRILCTCNDLVVCKGAYIFRIKLEIAVDVCSKLISDFAFGSTSILDITSRMYKLFD